jgi:DNA-binding XRE family transcriptional regulator
MIYFGGALMNQYVWETAEEMDAALAKRIRGIRKRRRLTQQDLSERSGVSLGTLNQDNRNSNIVQLNGVFL